MRQSHHLTVHTYTTQHKRKERGPNPCTQSSTCGLVSSRAWCIGGASHGSLPHPHKVLKVRQLRKLKICMQATLPVYVHVLSQVYCHAWLQGIKVVQLLKLIQAYTPINIHNSSTLMSVNGLKQYNTRNPSNNKLDHTRITQKPLCLSMHKR